MCKYKESIKNLENLVKSCGFLAYSKDIDMIKQLLEEHKKAESSAREKAIYILQDVELYGDAYYEAEDFITEVILGNKPNMPKGIVAEQLNCVLRAEIKDLAEHYSIELEDEDVEGILDDLNSHFSEDVLNRDFIVDTIKYYNKTRRTNQLQRLEYLLEKQKVCPLDKEESLELYELLN